MFDPFQKPKCVRHMASGENWEEDVDSVSIEKCQRQEDPLGYRVVFYRSGVALLVAKKRYVIGASLLRQRFESLKRAGFDAPMTLRAIRLIEKKLSCTLF